MTFMIDFPCLVFNSWCMRQWMIPGSHQSFGVKKEKNMHVKRFLGVVKFWFLINGFFRGKCQPENWKNFFSWKVAPPLHCIRITKAECSMRCRKKYNHDLYPSHSSWLCIKSIPAIQTSFGDNKYQKEGFHNTSLDFTVSQYESWLNPY